MSTRWYPLYQKGNPQLRIFLPNFWLKLISPVHAQPKNVVQFKCSMEMTKFDIKNYLNKIYDVHPVKVNTRIALGKTKKCPAGGYIIKEDDIKIAYVTLPKNETFTYPKLFVEKEEKSLEEKYQEEVKQLQEFVGPNKMPGLPAWFRI